MLTIQLGFCWPDLQHGEIEKQSKIYKYFKIHFFIVSIYWLDNNFSKVMQQAYFNLLDNENWLIENEAAIRLEMIKQKTEREKELESMCETYRERASVLSDENSRCRNDLRAALRTIELVKTGSDCNLKLEHFSNPDVTFQDILDDLEVAKKKFHYTDLCFTWATVDALTRKITELVKTK